MEAPTLIGSFRFRGTARTSPLPLIGCRRMWYQVDVDELVAVTGVTCWRNKRLNERLWAELSRVGVSKRDGHPSFVTVAGEFCTGSHFPWLSSAFLIGLPYLPFRRVLSFTGTYFHEGDTWTGAPETAFRLLATLLKSEGPDAFWRTFSADAGYAKQLMPGKEQRVSDA